MFYVTASKGGGKASVELCKSLASVLPRAVFERRGKKSMEGVVSRARKLGKPKVVIVTEKGGKPDAMRLVAVSASSWAWLGEELKIRKVELHPVPAEAEPISVKATKDSLAFMFRRRKIGPELQLECSNESGIADTFQVHE